MVSVRHSVSLEAPVHRIANLARVPVRAIAKAGIIILGFAIALAGTTTGSLASDTCGRGVLKNGTWTFACVDERGRNVCYFCPSNEVTNACSKTIGVCPS